MFSEWSKESIKTSLMTIGKTNKEAISIFFIYFQTSGHGQWNIGLSFDSKSKNTSLMIFGQTIFHISWPLDGNVPKIIWWHSIIILLNILFLGLSLVCFIHDTFLLPTFCTEPISLSAFWKKKQETNNACILYLKQQWNRFFHNILQKN